MYSHTIISSRISPWRRPAAESWTPATRRSTRVSTPRRRGCSAGWRRWCAAAATAHVTCCGPARCPASVGRSAANAAKPPSGWSASYTSPASACNTSRPIYHLPRRYHRRRVRFNWKDWSFPATFIPTTSASSRTTARASRFSTTP